MKKKLMAIVLAAACVMLTACDNGDNSGSGNSSDNGNSLVVSNTAASPDEKTSALLNEVAFPEMRKINTEELEHIYGMDKADLTECAAYICPSGMSPDEFGVFVAKDEATAANIKALLENRIQYQEDSFREYPPAAEQVYKLDDAFVEANGNVVYYAICADSTKARDILG